MNEKQYREICNACDEVLTAPEATTERTAIPWLHLIREHPSFLKNYDDLLAGATGAPLAKRFRFRMGWVRQLWRALWVSGQPWFGPQSFLQPVDILFVSHLVDSSQAGRASDFYFGDLPEVISVAGRRVVVALIDHSGTADAQLADSWRLSAVPHVIFSHSLGIREEWGIYGRLKRESARLIAQSRSLAPGLLKRVFVRASLEALSGSARTSLRMSRQINELVARVQPKALIVTYEGHAWERLAFAAARDASPSIQCIGYQHAALFRLQHGLRRMLQLRFNPDQLLAAGPISKKQLQDSPGLRGVPVHVLGSSRAGVAAIRRASDALRFKTCLVLPEGIVSECELLFKFSLNCARLLPHMRFIWRLHPLVSFEKLLAATPDFSQLPENVELSAMALEEDIARAGYALYRGSTAIVNAVCADVLPIYLECAGEMTIDPLHQMEGTRKRVVNPIDFAGLGTRAQDVSEKEILEKIVSREYCERFYTPFSPSVLLELLTPAARVD